MKIPQLCIRYTLQLGAISLPKTGNPEHMKSNAQLDFQISAEDMELLKNFKKLRAMVTVEFSLFMVERCKKFNNKLLIRWKSKY